MVGYPLPRGRPESCEEKLSSSAGANGAPKSSPGTNPLPPESPKRPRHCQIGQAGTYRSIRSLDPGRGSRSVVPSSKFQGPLLSGRAIILAWDIPSPTGSSIGPGLVGDGRSPAGPPLIPEECALWISAPRSCTAGMDPEAYNRAGVDVARVPSQVRMYLRRTPST
ncbi:uncharacterized protein N7482_004512 [Penicillium canariense]|uniref:Uncharacterized protein n=1 Tax=Penicillium canariense TaxID=189055 RepID=A0A9W9I8V9_9EURO|nr:uncharacterized protein N7482_004512 [Penicillium canariense]KAJ5168918.1 hypothetical protein N7482_004512 [Penicillium canariense]